MADYNDDLDPLAQMFREIREDRQHRSDEHTALRASDAYQGAIRQVDRYIFDYGLGINAIELMATRNPAYFDERISRDPAHHHRHPAEPGGHARRRPHRLGAAA